MAQNYTYLVLLVAVLTAKSSDLLLLDEIRISFTEQEKPSMVETDEFQFWILSDEFRVVNKAFYIGTQF